MAAILEPVSAAIVSLAGSDLNAGPTWRTASDSKPLDADNIYGTDGYLMFNTGYTGSSFRFDPNYLADASSDVPGFVSVSPGPAGLDGSVTASGFSQIDDPLNPGSDITSGSIARGGLAPGEEAGLLSLTFNNPAFPYYATLRLGVLIGNADFGNPAALRLTQDGQPTVSASVNTGSGVVAQNNWFFFDLTEVSAGDVFTLYGTEDTGDVAPFTQLRIGGLAFDIIPVPEPNAVTMLGLGVLMVRSALRRQRLFAG